MQHQLGREVRDLRITVRDDGLAVSGYTSTYRARQLIQQLVARATALPTFVDAIEIR